MTTYHVDCYGKNESIVNKGEKAYVIGKTSRFNRTTIKADIIENRSRTVPKCDCGEPDMPKAKLLTEKIEKEGIVTEVHNGPKDYWFLMEAT